MLSSAAADSADCFSRFVQVFFEGQTNMQHAISVLCQYGHTTPSIGSGGGLAVHGHGALCEGKNKLSKTGANSSGGKHTLHNAGSNNTQQHAGAAGTQPSPSSFDCVISHVVSVMLTCPLQLQLQPNGLQPFRGKDLLLPYQHMLCAQREFLVHLMQEQQADWNVYELCMNYKKAPRTAQHLDHLHVLHSLCAMVQSSKQFTDQRSQLVICNIVLQRIHSHVGISKPLQAALNRMLFSAQGEKCEKAQRDCAQK